MSNTTNSQSTAVSDPSLAVLTQELEQILRKNETRSSAFDWDDEPTTEASSTLGKLDTTAIPPSVEPDIESADSRFAFGKTFLWALIAVIGILGVGAYVLAWPFGRPAESTANPSQLASAPVSTIAEEKTLVPAPTISPPAATANQRAPEPKVLQAQVAPQPAERSTSEVIVILQALDRRMTNMEQAIEQIKAEQFRRTRETADLAGPVKQLQEKLAAPVNELAAELRAAEEKAARDRATTAEQLAKINEQLKAYQEQIERRKAAAQLQRAATVTRPQPQTPTTSAAPKPAPRPASAQAGAGEPRNSSPPQPAR